MTEINGPSPDTFPVDLPICLNSSKCLSLPYCTDLHLRSFRGKPLLEILEQGTHINAPGDEHGTTPLTVAVIAYICLAKSKTNKSFLLEQIRELLLAGANPNSRVPPVVAKSDTLLEYVLRSTTPNRLELIYILVQYGARIMDKNLLHLAVQQPDRIVADDAVTCLLRKGKQQLGGWEVILALQALQALQEYSRKSVDQKKTIFRQLPRSMIINITGFLDIRQWLDAPNADGKTALGIAHGIEYINVMRHNQPPDVVDRLLKAGACSVVTRLKKAGASRGEQGQSGASRGRASTLCLSLTAD